MSGQLLLARGTGFRLRALGACFVMASWSACLLGQPPNPAAPNPLPVAGEASLPPAKAPAPPADPAVTQASCPACSGGLFNGAVGSGCSSCGQGIDVGPWEPSHGPGGCGACCYPGRLKCCGCGDCNTWWGRIVGGLADCVCCPDPCYEPRWFPLADSAFFVDS